MNLGIMIGVTMRGGVPLAPELLVNGGFDTDTDWAKGTGWAISAGRATHTGATGSGLQQTVSGLTIGASYRLTGVFDTTGDTSLTNTAFQVRNSANTATVASVSGVSIAANTAGQALAVNFTATETSHIVRVFSEDGISVDDFSLKSA
jgi:hypothetical protein